MSGITSIISLIPFRDFFVEKKLHSWISFMVGIIGAVLIFTGFFIGSSEFVCDASDGQAKFVTSECYERGSEYAKSDKWEASHLPYYIFERPSFVAMPAVAVT